MQSAITRTDYAFPFRIDPSSGQAAQSPYATHVDEMIRQILLTAPGERADLPEFGCGLRQLLFAPNSDALQATTQLVVQRSLTQWLSNQINVLNVTVGPGPGGDYSQIDVLVEYVLLETQSLAQTQVIVT